MIIIVYSDTNAQTVIDRLGHAEYSYYFVLKEFLPALRQIGIVVTVTDPATEVDAIYRNALAHGQACVFLSFTAPHQTIVGLDCPTVPVFAWEFDRLPDEVWGNDERNDWRTVLRSTRGAITHSDFAVATVKAAMGADYPVTSIPAPVWDKFSSRSLRPEPAAAPLYVDLDLFGTVVDSGNIDLEAYSPQRIPEPRTEPWPHELPKTQQSIRIPTGGVVYTTVMNPFDARKNWFDLVSGFCWALRDHEDATLVLKLTYFDPKAIMGIMTENLYRLTPYKCRVLLVHAYLDDETYKKLADVTTYTVNAAKGEGQCLPLMEYMSLGKPAIAPRHSSMIDYINEDNAFIVDSSREPTFWPHDPRQAIRTRQHRISFKSLSAAYRESYRVAKEEPATYAHMSRHATTSMQRHCSLAVTVERLRAVIGQVIAGEHVAAAPIDSAPTRPRCVNLP